MSSRRIIVVGAGVGGLSAAVRLAVRGFHVTILEKNQRVGGKLNLWIAPHPARPDDRPFRFDTGPSLLTMPFVFMDLFAAVGEDVRDHLSITRLDPISRYVWRDGARLDLRAQYDDLLLEVRRFSPGDVFGFKRLLERGRRIWEQAEGFLSTAPERFARDGGMNPLKLLTVPFRIGLLGKFARTVDRHIRNPRLRDVLYQYATYSGASPWRVPATQVCVPWVEHYYGGWHIMGGMYRLAEQLERVARKLGVEIRTDTPVEQILVKPHGGDSRRQRFAAAGVKLQDGSELGADAVIANCDAVHGYRDLIPPQFRRRYDDRALARLDPGGSGVALMLGVEGLCPQLAHHTKFMPDDYRAGDLNAMFETRTIPRDPCIYVCVPTRTDPSLAPEGCECLFVLASAPPLLNSRIDWTIEGRRYRDRLVATLETRFGLTDLGKRIVVEQILTPLDMQRLYNANAGSIYGVAGGSLRSAFLRPPNRDREIRHLYFAGAATHPGGGLPLVALSGKIAADLVQADLPLAPE